MQTRVSTINERLTSNAALRRSFVALNDQPKELPLATISWFVMSGMSLASAAVVAAFQARSGMLALAGAAALLILAFIGFICGSLSWPGTEETTEDGAVSWEAVRDTLNCAFGLVLSGAAIVATIAFAVSSSNNSLSMIVMQFISSLLTVSGYGVASTIWATRAKAAIEIKPITSVATEKIVASVSRDVTEQVDELIAALQRAVVTGTKQQSSPARTLQALRAAATPVSLHSVRSNATPATHRQPPSKASRLQPVQVVSIEHYVKDDSAIGAVLELAVGSAERLIS